MKRIIFSLAIIIFLLDVYVFQADAQEFSEEFNQTFTTTKETTLFCGEPKDVAYYMGYNFQLIPVSMGTGWDMLEQKYHTSFLAASADLKSIAIMIMHEGKLCVSDISVEHKLYNNRSE